MGLLLIGTVVLPPQGTILSKAAVALFYGARGGFKMDSARPLQQLEKHSRTVDWDDGFVDGLCRALLACRVLCVFNTALQFHH